MKKYIYKIAITVLSIGALTSCEDNLDQLPFDEFATENAFQTAQDFENGVRGAYLGLTATGLYGSSDAGSMLSAPDILADNVVLAQGGRNTKRILHDWNYNADITMRQFYIDAYAMIYRANQVIFFADGFEGDNKANVVAEAKALRALGHLNLVSVFGKIPTQSGDANSSLGVAYLTSADPNILPERLTVGETYELIAQDLRDAVADINDTNPEGRMGKDAVRLLLSRTYLYMGQWQNAIDATNGISTPIAPRGDVVGVWEDTNRSGLLFYIPNEAGILGNSIGVTWSQGNANSLIPEYVASFELNSLYASDDIRRDAYIFDGVNGGNPVNGIKKLFARPGGQNGLVDYKILRSAEAALNRAEAFFNLNNESSARAELDRVRTRRYNTPPSGETGNALRDAIRLERRLEFAFEYQRFFDIKRWGQGVNRTNDGDLADGSGTASDELTLPEGSNRLQLPFGQQSLDSNPNLVQNPGY